MKKYLICLGGKEFYLWADEFCWRPGFMSEGIEFKKGGRIIAYFEWVDCWMEIYDSEDQGTP